jgi:alpha-glucosidase
LPFPPDAATRNYETQRQDPSSILHLYRRLIQHRRRSPALTLGTFDPIELPEGVLGYRRQQAGDAEVVVVNFTDRSIELPVDAGAPNGRDLADLQVVVSSDGLGEGRSFTGRVGGDQALVLARSPRTEPGGYGG